MHCAVLVTKLGDWLLELRSAQLELALGQPLHDSRSQGRGLGLPKCTVHVSECEIRTGGAQICPWGVCKQTDLKDDARMSVDLVKCKCMHVKQVQQLIKLKEHEACEGSCHNGDP